MADLEGGVSCLLAYAPQCADGIGAIGDREVGHTVVLGSFGPERVEEPFFDAERSRGFGEHAEVVPEVGRDYEERSARSQTGPRGLEETDRLGHVLDDVNRKSQVVEGRTVCRR